MIADVRLFPHGASVGSRAAPHVWCFVLAGALPRRGPAVLKRALDRATRLASAHRVVAVLSRESASQCGGLLTETPGIATVVQPAYRGSAGCRQLCGARECSDRQHLAFAADLDLALRKRGKVEPGACDGLLGDNELAGKVLGQAFEPARGIDGVADRSNRGGVAIAHLSDDGRPAMNADTDTQRPIELGPQRSVELGERADISRAAVSASRQPA